MEFQNLHLEEKPHGSALYQKRPHRHNPHHTQHHIINRPQRRFMQKRLPPLNLIPPRLQRRCQVCRPAQRRRPSRPSLSPVRIQVLAGVSEIPRRSTKLRTRLPCKTTFNGRTASMPSLSAARFNHFRPTRLPTPTAVRRPGPSATHR